MMDAVKLGKSQTELNAVTLPFVADVTKKYLPVASEDAVIEMTKVLVAEMDAIGSKDPVACYQFINPRPGDPSVSVADYISGELKNRDCCIRSGEEGIRRQTGQLLDVVDVYGRICRNWSGPQII